MDLNSTVQRNPELVVADLQEERIMLDSESGLYYGLAGVGAFIWDQLSEPKTIAELVGYIRREYDVEERDCFRDVVLFLEDLKSKDLVSIQA